MPISIFGYTKVYAAMANSLSWCSVPIIVAFAVSSFVICFPLLAKVSFAFAFAFQCCYNVVVAISFRALSLEMAFPPHNSSMSCLFLFLCLPRRILVSYCLRCPLLSCLLCRPVCLAHWCLNFVHLHCLGHFCYWLCSRLVQSGSLAGTTSGSSAHVATRFCGRTCKYSRCCRCLLPIRLASTPQLTSGPLCPANVAAQQL